MRNKHPKLAARFEYAMHFFNGSDQVIYMLQEMHHRYGIDGFICKWPRKDSQINTMLGIVAKEIDRFVAFNFLAAST